MNTLVIGNLISMVGCLIMVGIGLLRKKNHILIAQCVQCGFMGFGNLILGGTSGFVCNVVTVIRNLTFVKKEATTGLKIFFIALQILLSLGTLSAGWISWLPILAAALFTWVIDTRSAAKLKIVIIITQVMWLTYDLYYRNYVAAGFDCLTICSNLWGYFLVRKQN